MMPSELSVILREFKDRARMSITDLSLWLNLSYGTVRSWAIDARTPRAAMRGRYIRQRIALAEHAFKARLFPIPETMKAQDRRPYVQRILEFCLSREAEGVQDPKPMGSVGGKKRREVGEVA